MRYIILAILFISLIPSTLGALNDSLQAYYKMDEPTGGVISSLGLYNMSQAGTVNNWSGKINGSRGDYSTSNYFYNCSFPLNISSSYTLNAWSNQSTGSQYIISLGRSYSSDVFMHIATANGKYFGYMGGTIFYFGSATQPWNMVTLVFNVTDKKMYGYVNGVLGNISPTVTQGSAAFSKLHIGVARSNSCGGADGVYGADVGNIDEVGIWTRTMSQSEILDLYNNGTGVTYPFVSAPATISKSYLINLTQQPNDLNSSVVGTVNVTASVRNLTTNNTINNSSYMTIYYNVTSFANPCAIIENLQCTAGNKIKNMTKINNTYFITGFDDNEIFPSYYPFYEYNLDNDNNRSNYTLYLNNNIRFRIYNFTTYVNPYLTVEYDAASISPASLMSFYYCNSSYTAGNPSLSANCELLQSITGNGNLPYHVHNLSRHYSIQINIRNVTRTADSSIIITSSQPASLGYNFVYITNSTYTNRSFQIGSYNSWMNTNYIFDMHIHQYTANDSFRYYTVFNDGTGYTDQSNTVIDYFDIMNQRPTAPLVYEPNASAKPTITASQNTSITFKWTPSSDFENDTLTYSRLVLRNTLMMSYIVNANNMIQNVTEYNWSTNANYIPAGQYLSMIMVCDTKGACTNGTGQDYFTLCANNYVKSTQPCINSARLISYMDTNSCDTMLDVPSDNGTYESCQNIVYNQTVYTDDMLILMVLGFLLIISCILGIAVHEVFFGLSALLSILGVVVFMIYKYDDILIFASVILTILFLGMWLLVARVRRTR